MKEQALYIMETLTKKQAEALRHINEYKRIKGTYPTLREVAIALGKTFQAVGAIMDHLEQKGFVKKNLDGTIKEALTVNGEVADLVEDLQKIDSLFKSDLINKKQRDELISKIINKY